MPISLHVAHRGMRKSHHMHRSGAMQYHQQALLEATFSVPACRRSPQLHILRRIATLADLWLPSVLVISGRVPTACLFT